MRARDGFEVVDDKKAKNPHHAIENECKPKYCADFDFSLEKKIRTEIGSEQAMTIRFEIANGFK